MRVRSSRKRRSRACIVLKAREACRISTVPVSGNGGAFKSLPSRSAAAESEASGVVTRRTTKTESPRRIAAIKAIETRNCREAAGPLAGTCVVNESQWPSCSGTATCKSPKPPNGPKAPKPCIIGPCPIIGGSVRGTGT